MKHQSPTIILTGGGSGGHITPLLSLARTLKQQSPSCVVIYVGFKGDNFDSLKAVGSGFDISVFVNAGKFRRYHGRHILSRLLDIKTWLLNIRDFFRFIWSIGTAWRILSKYKPDVVFSKGGFVSVPVGIAAYLKSVPIITHDSDAVPGLANRIVGRWAKLRTSGMANSHTGANARFVGIPLSAEIVPIDLARQAKLKRSIGLKAEDRLLLVGSGGNGSATLNQLMLNSASQLLSSNRNLHIVHVAGTDHAQKLEEEYQAVLGPTTSKRARVFGFLNDFYKYSGAADLIVGRAGATALSEFAVQGKACIIIPSPFLAAGHQIKNAERLKQSDAAVVLDNNASADELISVVNSLLGNDKRRAELSANLSRQSVPNAAEILAGIIIKLSRGEAINESATK